MKKALIALFITVMAAQLYVPAQMILSREAIIREGEVFKFKTAPVDPSDPFRGKYINLNFEAIQYPLQNSTEEYEIFEEVFIHLSTDEDGFAYISKVTKNAPDIGSSYVKGNVQQLTPFENPEKMIVTYPFDRFYMEESKAYEAEVAYRDSMVDTAATTYALVHVKDGNAVITEVMIGNIPILELLKSNRKAPQ